MALTAIRIENFESVNDAIKRIAEEQFSKVVPINSTVKQAFDVAVSAAGDAFHAPVDAGAAGSNIESFGGKPFALETSGAPAEETAGTPSFAEDERERSEAKDAAFGQPSDVADERAADADEKAADETAPPGLKEEQEPIGPHAAPLTEGIQPDQTDRTAPDEQEETGPEPPTPQGVPEEADRPKRQHTPDSGKPGEKRSVTRLQDSKPADTDRGKKRPIPAAEQLRPGGGEQQPEKKEEQGKEAEQQQQKEQEENQDEAASDSEDRTKKQTDEQPQGLASLGGKDYWQNRADEFAKQEAEGQDKPADEQDISAEEREKPFSPFEELPEQGQNASAAEGSGVRRSPENEQEPGVQQGPAGQEAGDTATAPAQPVAEPEPQKAKASIENRGIKQDIEQLERDAKRVDREKKALERRIEPLKAARTALRAAQVPLIAIGVILLVAALIAAITIVFALLIPVAQWLLGAARMVFWRVQRLQKKIKELDEQINRPVRDEKGRLRPIEDQIKEKDKEKKRIVTRAQKLSADYRQRQNTAAKTG